MERSVSDLGLPEIRVEFKKLAETAGLRSARGILAVIVQDATDGVTWTTKTYTSAAEVDEDEFTAANYASICLAFVPRPYLVRVIRVGASGDMDDAATALESEPYNWVCSPASGLQAGLVSYVKSVNTAARLRPAKACVYQQAATADDIHVVSVGNTAVREAGKSSNTAMLAYLPRIAATLAACPMDSSVTYAALDDLEDVVALADPDDDVDKGKLVLVRLDEAVRIGRGVNTLQTVSGDMIEAMKKIAVVEAMDLMKEDIARIFRTAYQGKVRNSADNQALFVSDVVEYFRELEAQGVLDPDGENTADIDVAAMRTAWAAAGTDLSGLTDAQVRKKTFRSSVYVTCSLRILDAMEDMIMVIGLQ